MPMSFGEQIVTVNTSMGIAYRDGHADDATAQELPLPIERSTSRELDRVRSCWLAAERGLRPLPPASVSVRTRISIAPVSFRA